MTLTVAELRERIKSADDSDTVHVDLDGHVTDVTSVDTGGSEVILSAGDDDIYNEGAVITDGDFYEMWIHQNSFLRFNQGGLEVAVRPSSISYWTMHEQKALTLFVEGVKEPIRLFGEMARTVHFFLASSTQVNTQRVIRVADDNPAKLRLVEKTVRETCTE